MREKFVHSLEWEQLVTLFKQMLKNNHDGIIITEGENILMHNTTVTSLFTKESFNPNIFDLESSRGIENRALI